MQRNTVFLLEMSLADQPDLIKPFQSLNYREDSLFKSIMGYGSVQKGDGFEFFRLGNGMNCKPGIHVTRMIM